MLDELLPSTPGGAGEITPGSVWSGTIAAPPEGDTVEVTLDGWDPELRFGPARFQVRSDRTPQRGDACLVAFDEDRQPWVIAWGMDTALGGGERPALVWRGVYETGVAYEVGDVVTYGGSTYRATAAHTSTTPPPNDSARWAVLAAKGEKGDQGPQGPQGDQGPQGPAGPPNSLSIGTVQAGDAAAASITGTAPAQVLNLTLPRGPQGPKGDKGDPGPQGPPGVGLPTDATVGQIPRFNGVTWVATDPGSAYLGFSVQRAYSTGRVDSIWAEGSDITRDGSSPLRIAVSFARPVFWVVGWRALVRHEFAGWRRLAAGLYLDPPDAITGERFHDGIAGPSHHVQASDYTSIGGTAVYALNPGITYMVGIRLVWANGVTWFYHRGEEHTYIWGFTLPRQ